MKQWVFELVCLLVYFLEQMEVGMSNLVFSRSRKVLFIDGHWRAQMEQVFEEVRLL